MIRTLLSLLTFSSLGFAIALANSSTACGQTLSGGNLDVVGTPLADQVVFLIRGADLVVDVNGVESFFNLADVNSISISTIAGDDDIRNNTSIPMDADGGAGADRIFGGSGDDEIFGGGDDDSLFGRDGNDEIIGGSGTDFLFGGNGDDVLTIANPQAGDDRLFGGAGDDVLENGGEQFGGPGNDTLISRLPGARLSGGPGDDSISFSLPFFTRQGPAVFGGTGNDLIQDSFSTIFSFGIFSGTAEISNAFVDGGPGADVIGDRVDEPAVLLLPDGALLIAGGATDDSLSVTTELGMLVARVSNSTTNIEQIFAPEDVNSILLLGMEGDDVLVNSSDMPALFRGGFGDDVCVTNTDNDECRNTSDGGNDIYLLNGGCVDHRIRQSFESIFVMGSARDEMVELNSWHDGGPLTEISQIDLGGGDDYYFGIRNSSTPVIVRGGSGDDFLQGGLAANDEQLFGDSGDDVIEGNAGFESIFGGAGDDTIAAELIGNEINRVISGVASRDGSGSFVQGGLGNDVITGGGGADRLLGGAGEDFVRGLDGDDFLAGGIGNDTLLGEEGNDILRGASGNDQLIGGEGEDIIFGGLGDDRLLGVGEDDVLRGEGGNDELNGGAGDDLLFGGSGDDTLLGTSGNDRLNGEDGTDSLNGGSGTNVLNQ